MLPFSSEPDPPRAGQNVAPPNAEHTADRTADAPWSVSRLTGHVKRALQAGLPARVRVVGEVSNLSDRNHWYFSLKDETASVRAVMFSSAARKVGFPVASGMEVVATGRVDFYPAQGSVQLYVDRLEPVGQGARELALRALMEELRGAGYFDPDRKKPLPAVPRRVAVVTSRSAAALQDVIDTAARRWKGCELVHVDVRVQGNAAAPQIAEALRDLSANGAARGIAAVILTRGGGSIEDLWAFNERAVADALFECTLPVVAAIGHETDTTIAELVADRRCATPTQAAMTLIPDGAVLQQQVDQLAGRLALALRRRHEVATHRLNAAASHALFRRPETLIDAARGALDGLATRLHAAPARRAGEARRRLDALARTLDAVGPRNVLARGYSITRGPDGRVLRAAGAVRAGDTLTTVLADGEVASVVGDGDGAAAPPKPAPRKRLKTLKKPGTDEPMLFA